MQTIDELEASLRAMMDEAARSHASASEEEAATGATSAVRDWFMDLLVEEGDITPRCCGYGQRGPHPYSGSARRTGRMVAK